MFKGLNSAVKLQSGGQLAREGPVLTTASACADILSHNTINIRRQVELLNVFIGFEQGRQYALTGPSGEPIGYLLEEAQSLASMFARQFLKLHRTAKLALLDMNGNVLLHFHRPWYLLTSTINTTDVDGSLVGLSHCSKPIIV